MSTEYFQFKQFRIEQDRTAMKVGTDGVLLGAWATSNSPLQPPSVPPNSPLQLPQGGREWKPIIPPWGDRGGLGLFSILDIGTGTGLLSLIAAQELPHAVVTAIDIDADAVGQARQNVSQSPWADRIQVLQTPLQQFTPTGKFDLILSNPPYFIKSQKSPDRQRSLARHADTLPMPTLMKHSASMLTPQGSLAIIIPSDIVAEAERWAAIYGLFLTHRLDIKTVPSKPSRRSIVTFSPSHPESIATSTQCIHNPDGTYTPWYTSLTERLYL